MELFDDFQRTYEGFKEPRESNYAFLNRSARPEYEHIRHVLEQWFLGYPEQHRHALRASFRSRTESTHLGAFFELYCHELLKQQGFLVQAQQIVDQTVGRPVDFLVLSTETPLFYVEATLAADSNASSTSQKLLWQLQDTLNELNEPLFQVSLEVESESIHSLPTTQIRRDIHRWLQTLDSDEVARRERDDRPYYYFEREGWKIIFLAIPRAVEERGKPGNTVLYQLSVPQWSQPQSSLSVALESKADQYGELQLPYIIAVDMVAMTSFGSDIGKVLFGQEVFLINTRSEEMTVTRSPLLPDRPSEENGLWFARRGPRNQQVSAVLLVKGLVPWSLVSDTPVLWHNPYATKPLNPDLWQGPQMIADMDTLQIRRREGKAAWEMLHLDPGS